MQLELHSNDTPFHNCKKVVLVIQKIRPACPNCEYGGMEASGQRCPGGDAEDSGERPEAVATGAGRDEEGGGHGTVAGKSAAECEEATGEGYTEI